MIARDLSPQLLASAGVWPAVTITGPRQSGKTTLCRALFPHHAYSSLEAPDTRAFANEDPRAYLDQFPKGAVLDEVQRTPDLLSYLQVIIDEDPRPGRWILTGSQNLALLQSISQSLAGRTAIHYLLPLSHNETKRFSTHPESLNEVLFWGSYPRVFDRELDPTSWYRSYVATYIERDVRSISNVTDLSTFQKFISLSAGRSSQLLNHSALAGDCGISQPTANAWCGILETQYLVFRLPAFHSNLRKRLVKMPKLHFFDTGLLCWLLGIRSPEQLRTHPLRGAIFETWVASEIAKHRTNIAVSNGLSFYRDRNGAEAHMVIQDEFGTTLIEAKSSQTPSSSLFDRPLRVLNQLKRESIQCALAVVYGGDQFQRRSQGTLLPWFQMADWDWRNPLQNLLN